MDTAVNTYFMVRLGALIVAVLITLVSTVIQMRRRSASATGRAAASVLTIVAVGVIVLRGTARPSVLWIAALLVAGAALGLLSGKMARPYQDGSRVAVKRSPIPPLIGAVAYILMMITLLFGTTYLLAIALLIVVFSAGLTAANAVVEARAAQALKPPAAPAPGPVPSA